MDIDDLISQIRRRTASNSYRYHCCNETFEYYDFRLHLSQFHPKEYRMVLPLLHRKPTKLPTKEELKASISKAKNRKKRNSRSGKAAENRTIPNNPLGSSTITTEEDADSLAKSSIIHITQSPNRPHGEIRTRNDRLETRFTATRYHRGYSARTAAAMQAPRMPKPTERLQENRALQA